MEKPNTCTMSNGIDYYDSAEMDAYISDLEARMERMRKALGYVITCDVNPRTSELSQTTRLQLAAREARAALADSPQATL